MHILYTHYIGHNIHVNMYMGKPWEEHTHQVHTWKGISKQIRQDWRSEHMLQPGLGSIITCFDNFILEFQ